MEKYHILELIGEGQFGKVYKGRRKYGSQLVALKFIAKKGKTDKALADLRSEIDILNSLTECEYVIKMLDWFETRSEICVVTEYAQGELFEILEDDGTMPESTVRLIAIQLVQALQYLHANRIIHRDMKPQNILIGANGTVKLCDFGFARSMSANTSLLTSIKGTPLYMAPELVRDMPYNHTTDLWSLGCVLYELFVGQPPFFTNSFYTLVHLIVDNPVNYPPTMSDEFKDFLQGLLQKTPSKRLSWPHLASHPFIRETAAEEAARAEAIRKVSAQQIYDSDHVVRRREQTPRGKNEPEVKGFGGIKKPPTASYILEQQAQRAQQTKANALSTRAGHASNASSTASYSSSSSSSSHLSTPSSLGSSGGVTPTTRSRAASAEFDVSTLASLLANHHVTSIQHALSQLASLLQHAAASTMVPSSLLELFPKLMAEHVPTQLCDLLAGVQAGNYTGVVLADIFAHVLLCMRLMVHPTGGRVALTPLHFDEASSGPGRSLPLFEVQIRRVIAERIAHTDGLFGVISAAFCSAVSSSDLTAPTAQPSAALSNLVILLFQCARSSTSATAGGFIDLFVRDGALLTSIMQLLTTLTGHLDATDLSDRARTTGRVLFLLAMICSRVPSIVKTMVTRITPPFEPIAVLRYMDHPNQLVSIAASYLLSQLLTNQYAQMAPQVAQPLALLQVVHAKIAQLSSTATPVTIAPPTILPPSASHSPVDDVVTPICALEGTGLMYSLLGSLDGYLQVIQAILYFLNLQANNPSMHVIEPSAVQPTISFLVARVWSLLLARLERLHSYKPIAGGALPSHTHRLIAGELSVNGWVSLLTISLDLLKYVLKSVATSTAGASATTTANFDTLFRGMCDLLSPQRIASLYAWPDGCGGGSTGVGILFKRVLSVLYLPTNVGDGAMLARVLKLFFNEGLVRRLLMGLKYTETPSELEPPVTFISQLCMRDAHFGQQLLEHQGLQIFSAKGLLNPDPRVIALANGGTTTVTPSATLLIEPLHVVTQLARRSAEYYPQIHQANFYADFTKLLHHADDELRKKACIAIGNLCRHSAFFYPALLAAHGLLPSLVAACDDPSSGVRAWAAFALGNAAFYDPSLVDAITPAIPSLLRMLRPEEGMKAASHAVGVLANLLRHGRAANEIVRAGAVPMVVAFVHDVCAAPPSSAQLPCVRSATFALGHLAAVESAREQLRSHTVLQRLQAAMNNSKLQDAKVQTYFNRLQAKLQPHS